MKQSLTSSFQKKWEYLFGKGRIPVRFELDKRVIDLNSLLCPWCESSVETIDHCIIGCLEVKETWEKIYSWWGLQPENVSSVSKFLPDGGKATYSDLVKSMWQATQLILYGRTETIKYLGVKLRTV